MADEGPNGEPAIGVANLFAFSRRARSVGDWNLRDLFSHPAELGGDFGTELEALAVQTNLREQRAAEDFVAGGFVVDASAVEQVGEMSQKLCAEKKSEAAL